MPSDPRQTAVNLVRLATESPNEGEARNSAMAACRLIAKHDLLGLGKRASVADIFEEMMRQPAPRPRRRKGFGWEDDPGPAPEPKPEVTPVHERVKDMKGTTWYRTEHTTAWTCQGCHLRIEPYAVSYASKSHAGHYHESCWKVRFMTQPSCPLSEADLDELMKGL